MKFTPKTEQELAEQGLAPKGTYPFDVVTAEERVSKTSGRDMIAVEIVFYLPDGGSRKITDYLMESVAFKLHSFCKSTGLLAKYNQGNFGAEDCEGRSGYVNIAIEPSKPKEDGSGDWPAKNKVASYSSGPDKKSDVATTPKPSARPAPSEAQQANVSDDTGDDSIPF